MLTVVHEDRPYDDFRQDGQEATMSKDIARHIHLWGKTIERWARGGEECFFITKQNVRRATLQDVANAAEQLRKLREARTD